jgi:prepilin-type N-terminal cleavage/methylation domain-containing protein
MNKQSGFTLVEIAIVLVIIGLLLGGVLKGQEIITSAKIKSIEKDFNGVSAAIYNYQDRYRSLPGDDKKAKERFGTTITSGDGDWKIEGVFDTLTDDQETRLFWLHLRNGSLVAGDVADQAQPSNAFSGVVGASSDKVATLTGLFVGFSKIPKAIAEVLDTRNDDGKPKTGSIQAKEFVDPGSATDLTDGTGYKQEVLHNVYYAM